MENKILIETPAADKDEPAAQCDDEWKTIDMTEDDPMLRGRIVQYWHAVSDWSVD